MANFEKKTYLGTNKRTIFGDFLSDFHHKKWTIWFAIRFLEGNFFMIWDSTFWILKKWFGDSIEITSDHFEYRPASHSYKHVFFKKIIWWMVLGACLIYAFGRASANLLPFARKFLQKFNKLCNFNHIKRCKLVKIEIAKSQIVFSLEKMHFLKDKNNALKLKLNFLPSQHQWILHSCDFGKKKLEFSHCHQSAKINKNVNICYCTDKVDSA